MQQEEGIVILLSICYFSPLYSNYQESIETFNNILNEATNYINPQGSIGNNQQHFNPGSSVRTIKWKNPSGNIQTEPGNPQSLNMTDVQASFPYFEQSKISNNEKIQLIKKDGVITGGYVPQILRPSDNVSLTNNNNNKNCNEPCYTDYKHQKWCNEKNAMMYYGMRPIITPEQYNDNLKKLFNSIIDEPKSSGNIQDDKYTAVFCTETKESIMSWLMQKIAKAVENMPSMKRNGPWEIERFYHTDVKMYQYIDDITNQLYFKLIFNLYNPLRSISTLVQATIHTINEIPILKDIDFVNSGMMNSYIPSDGVYGPINGQNISPGSKGPKYGNIIDNFQPLGFDESPEGIKEWENNYKSNPNDFDWNYKNTLQIQKFNKNGFYSNNPQDNIEIEGGIPDSLKEKLKACSQENLMSCMTPRYSGISSNIINNNDDINGDVKNVYNNPQLVYSIPTLNIRDSKIDTIERINS